MNKDKALSQALDTIVYLLAAGTDDALDDVACQKAREAITAISAAARDQHDNTHDNIWLHGGTEHVRGQD